MKHLILLFNSGNETKDEGEIAVIEEADVEEDEAENAEGQMVHNEKVAKTLQERRQFFRWKPRGLSLTQWKKE